MHRERALPNGACPADDPFHVEWTKLDERLNEAGASAKSRVVMQLLPLLKIPKFMTTPCQWVQGAFKLPLVYVNRRGCHQPILHEVMDLEQSNRQFKNFVLEQDGSYLPTANALHSEQYFVSRSLLISADRLRTAVAVSNLVQMRRIRVVMGNLLESLENLVQQEIDQRKAVSQELKEEE